MDAFSTESLEFDKLRANLAKFVLTGMGREAVESVRPHSDKILIKRDLAFASEMKELLMHDDSFPIDTLKDVRKPIKKVTTVGFFLQPPELLEISSTFMTARRVQRYFKKRREKYSYLHTLTENLSSYQNIENAIQSAIDEEGQIRDNASGELRRIRRELVSQQDILTNRLKKILKKLSADNMTQEDLITVREGRMVIPIKDEYKNRVKGFIHDESATGQTVFIEPASALPLNNSLKKLRIEELREIERILRELTGLIRDEFASIIETLAVLKQLDFIHAKGRLAVDLNAHCPVITDKPNLKIVSGFHPLLLIKAGRNQTLNTIIPLDLEIGTQFRTLVITGPNAGGKTVALKTVGLLTLMVQSGLLVPADPSSEFYIFDKIFADIGDDQSIENDLSTFSSHMAKLAAVVDTADAESLVLVDEIATGTDPDEGSLLAISILSHLTRNHVTTISTTHHGALKIFAAESPGIENGSMEFDTKSLIPTYRFQPGTPGSSYAFEISERLGLRKGVIEEARNLGGSEHQDIQKLLADLQKKNDEQRQLIATLELEKNRLQALEKLYSDRMDKIKQYEKEQKDRALKEAENILSQANKLIEFTVKTIKEEQASTKSITEAKAVLTREKDKIKSEISYKIPTSTEPVSEGDLVRIESLGMEGLVVETPDDSGEVFVEAGNIRLKVDSSSIKKIEVRNTKPETTSGMSYDWTEDIKPEIDVRGSTAEEAVDLVDRYLGDAGAWGLSKITIIHGKGTGVLRKKVNQFLKKDKRVKTQRPGDYFEGDVGVTIVELNP